MLTAQIKATLIAAMLDTVNEGKFNNEYVWMQVRRIHAAILVPTGIVQAEDICWQWVMYEVAQLYQDYRVSLSLYLFYSPTHTSVNCSQLMSFVLNSCLLPVEGPPHQSRLCHQQTGGAQGRHCL